MILYRTPGRSFTRPPRTSTIECSCRLWPSPGMYAVTSTWLVSFTRATFRSAEFGFFGVVLYTRVHTPRRCGLPFRAAVLTLAILSRRPLRTSCWMVGMYRLSVLCVLRLQYLASLCTAVLPRHGVFRHPATGCVARARHRSNSGTTVDMRISPAFVP